MISVIICSKDPHMLQLAAKNVYDTIGVEHEIISIDNGNNGYGICKAYNTGAEKSRFAILCFMHEDLIFHTPNWGSRVLKHLSDSSIGLIGVAGGTYKSKGIESWGLDPIEYARVNILQDRASGRPQEHLYSNPFNESVADVVSVDGLWLCTRKEVWQKNKFDDINFKEFHFYDLDFSLQVIQSSRVCVVFDILIEHKSEGNVNRSWLANAIIFHEKWRHLLPYSIDHLYDEKKKQIERKRAKRILFALKAYHFNRGIYLRYYIRYLMMNSFGENLQMLKKYIMRFVSLKPQQQ